MAFNSEKIASDFLELASEQRLNILKNLSENHLSISKLAKLLDATNPEVHRNVGRLSKSGLAWRIAKTPALGRNASRLSATSPTANIPS